jgi:hypothetical protein
MSEKHEEEKANNTQETKVVDVTKKSGLRLFGYVVPWWVVVVVVLLLVYVLYDQGYLEDVLGKPAPRVTTVVRLPESSVLPQANAQANVLAESGLETPQEVRNLFGRSRKY